MSSAGSSSSCTSTSKDRNHYLKLSTEKLTFEGASKSKLTNVFYDESNLQVFSVRSGDITEVNVVSPNKKLCTAFQLKQRGHIVSMKFCPKCIYLSIQCSEDAIEFYKTELNQPPKYEFSYNVLHGPVLGYVWIEPSYEIAVVTSRSIEACNIHETEHARRLTLKHSIQWFRYFAPHQLLLVHFNEAGNYGFHIVVPTGKNMKKFTFGEARASTAKPAPTERDVIMGMIYSMPRILVLTCQSSGQMAICVYTYFDRKQVNQTHELRIKESGRFALSIVDNLVVVHNQISKKSFIYDIGDDDFHKVVFRSPIVDPCSICPDESSQLYSLNWALFQPNIVLDAKLGTLAFLELDLHSFIEWIPDRVVLISFLLMRSDSKEVLANSLLEIISKEDNMETLSQIFDRINKINHSHLLENLKSQMSLSQRTPNITIDPNLPFKTILDQTFIFTFVFSPLVDKLNYNERCEVKRFNRTLLEYIRSLHCYEIRVPQELYKMLVQTLVMNKEFFQLHQLLQYHVIADSKMMACVLLSLESLYPAALQLALDMLERLGSAKEEIIEILSSKNQLVSASKYKSLHFSR